jgi:hypothetical protein
MILRIIFWNCGGFPNARDHPKNDIIRQVLMDTQADMAALAEINTSWKMVPPCDRLRERTWGWFSAIHIAYSYAYEFPVTSGNQAGGTAINSLSGRKNTRQFRQVDFYKNPGQEEPVASAYFSILVRSKLTWSIISVESTKISPRCSRNSGRSVGTF